MEPPFVGPIRSVWYIMYSPHHQYLNVTFRYYNPHFLRYKINNNHFYIPTTIYVFKSIRVYKNIYIHIFNYIHKVIQLAFLLACASCLLDLAMAIHYTGVWMAGEQTNRQRYRRIRRLLAATTIRNTTLRLIYIRSMWSCAVYI